MSHHDCHITRTHTSCKTANMCTRHVFETWTAQTLDLLQSEPGDQQKSAHLPSNFLAHQTPDAEQTKRVFFPFNSSVSM